MGEKTAERALAVARYALATHRPETPPAEVGFTPEMEKDEAAQAVASLEHPEAFAAAALEDFGPPPESVEIEEEYDPDVVPAHLGTPPAAGEETPAAEGEEEERA
jgi:hypothetical protein